MPVLRIKIRPKKIGFQSFVLPWQPPRSVVLPSRYAFTLIELLVVIAIIAVLIASFSLRFRPREKPRDEHSASITSSNWGSLCITTMT